ncbi:MAG: efflux RND transporter periplasmic adaptor subunit [Christensenellales bacterium]
MDGVTLGTATLEVNKPMAVSSYGGTIESVHTQAGKTVKRGETLFKLTDSPITLKLENLRLQRETANKSLEEAKEQRENLIVIAPCDGTIATLNVSEGDEITNGALIGSILEGEDMNLTIAVDELDVVEVAVGQKVKITVDALSDAESGRRGLQNRAGRQQLRRRDDLRRGADVRRGGSGVRSGMNATGEITVASTDDTLYVPVEALMTIGDATYLMVENGDGQTAAMPDFGGMTLPDHADFGVMTPPDGAPADATGDTAETSDSGENRSAARAWRLCGAADRTGERQRVHQSRRGGESVAL